MTPVICPLIIKRAPLFVILLHFKSAISVDQTERDTWLIGAITLRLVLRERGRAEPMAASR